MHKTTEELFDENPKMSAIIKLYEWSGNYPRGINPWALFLDLIGYSEDQFGVTFLKSEDWSQITGAIELDLIGHALIVFANLPNDTRDFLNEIVEVEYKLNY